MPKKRTRVITAVVGVVMVLIVAALRSVNWYQPRITQAEVKHEIKQHLPPGSSVAQTVAFLAERHWVDPHNVGIYTNNGNNSSDGFEAKDLAGRTLTAGIPDAYPGFLVSGGIFMKFGFNSKGRLTRYELRDVYTWP